MAMRDVGKTMQETDGGQQYLADEALQETAATALRAIAYVERGIVFSIDSLRERLPPHWRDALAATGSDLRSCLSKLKTKAVDLLKQELLRDMQAVQRASPSADDSRTQVLRNSINQRLAKLTRKTQDTGIHVMLAGDGSTTSDPEEIAELLRAHWARVFGHQDIDRDKLEKWLRCAGGAGCQKVSAPADAWKLRTRDISRALLLAGNSRPGPDGIPHEAWRRLCTLRESPPAHPETANLAKCSEYGELRAACRPLGAIIGPS